MPQNNSLSMDGIAYHLGRVVEEKLTDGLKGYDGISYAAQQRNVIKARLYCPL